MQNKLADFPHMIVFEGRILPESRNVSAPTSSVVSYDDHQGFEGEFTIVIKESAVRVECRLNSLDSGNVSKAMARAHGFATGIADVIAFATGWSLKVILDQMIIGDKISPLVISELRVAPYCMAYSLDSGFEQICELVLTNTTLRFAMNDLITAIASENYPLIASGRSTEAIRHLIAGFGLDPKTSWPAMRAALRLDESYLREIIDASTKPRHGVRDATGEAQLEMLTRAWTVMNRYLEYRKRGGRNSLPPDEFPVLKG